MQGKIRNLRDLRKMKGYTQEKVAKLLDIDRSTLSRIEKGEVKRIPLLYFFKLSELYNTPIKELLEILYPEATRRPKFMFRKELPLTEDEKEKLKAVEEIINNLLFLKEILKEER